ncbi:MAG TPA: hypothetical protein VFW19_17685 [Allosphingosinicella sp.]|nr:hypothetical protein [Allosphingosinicella sp.]
MISAIEIGRSEARIDALRAEFGAIMAARMVEAEAADFLWETRVSERYLGQHLDVEFGGDDECIELSRIAVLSLLDRRWHASVCLVDGEGAAVDLLWKQDFQRRDEAEAAYDRAA